MDTITTGAWRNLAPASTNPGEFVRFRVNAMAVSTREIASALPALLRATFGPAEVACTWDAFGPPCAVESLSFDVEALYGTNFSPAQWLAIRQDVAAEVAEQVRFQYYDAI
jgi:hypothetical protein